MLAAGRKSMRGHDNICIDLQEADCANTAGLALLVEWSTWSLAEGRALTYVNPAKPLLDLIALNSVGQLLNITAE